MKDLRIGLRVALLLIVLFLTYLTGVTFWEMPPSGQEQAKTIVPFLLGVIATLIGFYWGNSSKRQDAPPYEEIKTGENDARKDT